MAGALHALHLLPERPGDRLEMAVTWAEGASARGALLFSPQPLLGGDMDNNVVRALADALADAGWPAVRFNYRSVGASHDVQPGRPRYEHWHDVEERDDHGAVLDDAQEALERAGRLFEPGLLVGYSFGAWVACALARRCALRLPRVLVAPPLDRHDFGEPAADGAPGLMLLAGADALTPLPGPDELARRFPSWTRRVLPDADHFFLGREPELSDALRAFAGGLPAPARRAPPREPRP